MSFKVFAEKLGRKQFPPEVKFYFNEDIFTMASFYYNYQNPSGFCFLMSYCCLLSTRITKFEFEKENEMTFGSCSKMTPS